MQNTCQHVQVRAPRSGHKVPQEAWKSLKTLWEDLQNEVDTHDYGHGRIEEETFVLPVKQNVDEDNDVLWTEESTIQSSGHQNQGHVSCKAKAAFQDSLTVFSFMGCQSTLIVASVIHWLPVFGVLM